MSNINLTTLTYNEGHRLRDFLKTAKIWSHKIFIVDKGSTDDTLQIAEEYGCEIIKIPFSLQGCESNIQIFELLKSRIHLDHNWLLWLTPGEVVNNKLIKEIENIISNSENDSVDVIFLPIKFFSFGKVRNWGYWKNNVQPRLVNIRIVQIQDIVHNHIITTDKSRFIHDDGTKFIIHPTHSDFSSFIKSHHDYALNETFGVDIQDRVKISHQLAEKFDFDFFNFKVEDDIRPYYAWKIYCYMVALRSLDYQYASETKDVMSKFLEDFRISEWDVHPDT